MKVQLLKKRKLLLVLGAVLITTLGHFASAQTPYLTENFDGAWTGTPAAPSGWTQTSVIDVNVGGFDWQANTFTTAWAQAGGTMPTTASPVSGQSALWINDFNFGSSSLVRQERRMESPTIDLSASTSPYVRFWYFNAQDAGLGANVRVVISTDNGLNWRTLSNVLNGYDSAANTWTRISVAIPQALRSATTKIGFSIINRYGSNNPFIDDVTVEEYTPNTITSIATGNWNSPATWSTNTVPRSGDHVVISGGHIVTVPAVTGLVARCQNLTINASGVLTFATTAAANMHVYGNVTVNGTFNAFNGTSGRIILVGGNYTINAGGSATHNTGTTLIHAVTTTPTLFSSGASALVFTNAAPASFTNNGTLTAGRVNNIIHLGSDTFTYNSAVGVPFVFGLWNGTVNPNNNLTLGNAAASATSVMGVGNGFFTAAPIFNNTNITQRNYLYYSVNMIAIDRSTRVTGQEVPIVSTVRTISGALILNTVRNIELGYPMTVGTSTTGALTLTRGVLITSATNLLRFTNFFTPGAGVDPSIVNPNPTSHGSYIAGPVRIDMPTSGTVARTIPLGVGTSLNGLVPNSNMRRVLTLTPGTGGWSGQSITFSIETNPTGTVSSPITALSGVRSYRLNLNGGADLPATATLTVPGMNYTFGNTDNLVGNLDNIFLVQSTTNSGPWTTRSVAGAAGAIVNNTTYTRITTATIAPLATNGGFFTWATNLPLMVYDSTVLVRNTDGIAPGALANTQMMRVNIRATGQANPLSVSQFFVRTAGTGAASLAKIDTLKVWFTGSNPNFSAPTRFGSNVNAPGASASIAGSQVLTAGDNFFWFTYDINASSVVGDTFAIQIDSSNIGGLNRIFTSPTPGVKLVATPALYSTSALSQPITQRVGAGNTNQIVARLAVTMGAGAPAPLTNIDVSTNGTTSLADITNLRVYFTGATNGFSTANQFGTTIATPALNNSVTGTALLSPGVNYFWITYDIATAATINNVIDAEVTAITVNSTVQTPTVTAPAGNRQIRINHCDPAYTIGKTDGDLISRVRIIGTSLDNNSGTAPVNPAYTYFTGSPNFTTQLVQGSSYVMEATIGSFGSQGVAAWIDYNDDGVFQATERIGFTPTTIPTGFGSESFPITLSCASTPGTFRMRVRCVYATNGNTIDPCLSYAYGEGEDYEVMILPNPTVFNSSIATQQTGTVAQNTQNLPVLRTPIRVTGCQVALLNNMYFRYSGTNVSDITSAKIYRTTNSTFSTANLISTIASPTTNMVFSMADSLVVNDTTWYWLAFDVAPTAVISNTIDAIYDSVNVINGVGIPSITNPAGNITIQNPILYLSSSAIHPTLTKAETNLSNQMLRVRVIMSSTGSPAVASQLALSVNGSVNPLTNIDSITVWYTGANANFTSPIFFGGVGPQAAAFNVTGSQNLLPDTNYFWVNYRVPLTANLGDSIDAEISSITISGNPQVPTNGAPAGARYIRGQYCLTTYASGCGTDYVARVRLENLDNSSLCTGPYTYYNNVNVPNLVAGSTYTITLNYGPDGNQYGRAWIDYNDDGDFADPGEDLGSQNPANAGMSGQATITFTVPCSATPGRLRLRVRGGDDAPLLGTQSCAASSSGYGEGEDYDINIQTSPASYISSTTQQQTGTTSAGTTDLPILRVPIRVFATSCLPGVITQLNFNTFGTTAPANIVAAKLYKTGNNSSFSVTNLVGTVFSPNGQFSFILSDTAVNDTNNYWLAYDLSPSAPNGNVLDARFDSAQIFGSWYVPAVGNPTGNVVISTPMTYLSSTSAHTTLAKIERGSNNNQILRIRVNMSTAGATVAATQLNLSVNGSSSPATNIDSISVWYTGSNPNFTSPTFYGGVGAQTSSFTVSGLQNLLNDSNFFWVTYRVPSTALIGDSVDAEINSITIAGNAQIPTITAPAGARLIRAPYCASAATMPTSDGEIWNVTVGSLNNTSTCATTGGTGSIQGGYANYTATVAAPNLVAGSSVPFSVNTSTCGGPYDGVLGIWIDYNDDGDFTDAGEEVHMSPVFQYGTTVFRTGNIIIPLNIGTGLKRMRVVLEETNTTPISPCTAYGFGETEDYTVNILPAPAPTTYVWNQTAPGSFTTSANWAPARVNVNLNDRLLFNNGGNVTVNDVTEQSVASITVNNNSVVSLNAISTSVLNTWDSLTLTSGRLVPNTNLELSVGRSNGAGAITGTGSVQGALTRWIDNVNTNYVFPLSLNNQSRTAAINMNAPLASTGTIKVDFVSGNPSTAGIPFNDGAITVNKLAQLGLWSVSTGNGLTLAANTNYDLSLTASGVIGVTNLSSLTMARRSNIASLWDTAGTFVTATGTIASPVVNRGSLRVFGEFAIGADSNVNPLPVNLIELKAKELNGDVSVNWATSSEQNNKGFFIERSIDGQSFDQITFVQGKGNSNVVVNYGYIDPTPFKSSAILYYRLRQIDLDGKEAISSTVQVQSKSLLNLNIVAFPIPFTDNLNLALNASAAGDLNLTMYDLQGRVVRSFITKVNLGKNEINIPELETLRTGVYFLKLEQSGDFEVIKVMKQ